MRPLFALALLAGAATADEPKKPDDKKPEPKKAEKVAFESKAMRFAATFPGKPEEMKSTVQVGSEDVVITRQGVDLGPTYYTVATNDYKPGVLDPDPAKVLLGVRNGNIGEGQLLTEDEKRTEFGPNKLPMREFTFKKDKLFFRNLIVLEGDRLFQVMVVATEEKALTGADAKQLYESFQILPREKKK